MSPVSSLPPKSSVVTVVAYPSVDPVTSEPLRFDMEYVITTHMPLTNKVWGPHGMISWSIESFLDRTLKPDEQPPPYSVFINLYWDKVEQFEAALADANTEIADLDVANFSNIFPVIWTGGVVQDKDEEEIAKDREFIYGKSGL